MVESPIWACQCASTVSKIYRKLFDWHKRFAFAFPYLDDALVYPDDFGSHVDHLRRVFQILRGSGIKVKIKKMQII